MLVLFTFAPSGTFRVVGSCWKQSKCSLKSSGIVGTLVGVGEYVFSHEFCENVFVGLGCESQLASIAIVTAAGKLDFIVKRQYTCL